MDEVASGTRIGLRAAAFKVAGEERSGVVLSVAVPRGFHEPLPDDAVSASVLLNPTEARGLALWLTEAADAAINAAPPLYPD